MTEISPHVGLIGGLATRAGIFYYELIQRIYEREGRALDLTLRHADVGRVLDYVQDSDHAGLGEYLGQLSNELFDAGVELVAVTAIAPHMAIREITNVARGPVVSVLDAVPNALSAAGIERVTVFGNRAVMETDIFGSVDSDMVVRLDSAALETVHNTYTDVALHGKRSSNAETELFASIADQAMSRGAQAVILAGTDLSSFYAETPPQYPHLDLAKIHVDQIGAYR